MKVKLEIFEGPLDLLLYLIQKNEIDITNIPVAQVAQQYLEYLDLMQALDLNIAGEFLVMAATLMHIKSKMLLPPEEVPAEEGEEADPRVELVQKLLEYKKFKEAAEELQKREKERMGVFTRSAAPVTVDESGEVFFEATLFDLLSAFSKALKEVPRELFHEVIAEPYTVEKKIHDLLHLLVERSTILLKDLFEQCERKLEIIVTFLAVLELIRLREVVVLQRELFGEIEVQRNTDKIYEKPQAVEPAAAEGDGGAPGA